MTIFRQDDPPLNIGKPRESFLARRVYRLEYLEEKRPGKFTEQLREARFQLLKEIEFNMRIDGLY